MSQSKKVYGLILPQKDAKAKPVLQKASVFAQDDDSDQDQPKAAKPKTASKKTFIKKQVQADIEKALAEDPNAFDYDEVYDDVQAKKLERNAAEKSNVDRKPKFIHSLLKAASDRKKEDERRIERSVQRERESEKGLFDDKEAFVTESFRQKMREQKEEEENLRKKKEMEEKNDITKTGDYSGFYQNLLNRRTGQSEPIVKTEKPEKEEKRNDDVQKKDRKDTRGNRSSSDDDSDEERHRARQTDLVIKKDKNYRSKEPEDKSQSEDRSREHRHSKVQKERKRSRSSESESDEDRTKQSKKRSKDSKSGNPVTEIPHHTGDTDISMSSSSSSDEEEMPETTDVKSGPVDAAPSVSSDSKKSIFDKKTTSDAFADARARYLARKGAMKLAIANDD